MKSSFKEIARTTRLVERTFACVDETLVHELGRTSIRWDWREVSINRFRARARCSGSTQGSAADEYVWYRLRGTTSHGETVTGVVRYRSHAQYSGGESYDNLKGTSLATHVSLSISADSREYTPGTIVCKQITSFAKYQASESGWLRCKR